MRIVSENMTSISRGEGAACFVDRHMLGGDIERYSDVTVRSVCPAGPKLLNLRYTLTPRAWAPQREAQNLNTTFHFAFIKRAHTASMRYTGTWVFL